MAAKHTTTSADETAALWGRYTATRSTVDRNALIIAYQPFVKVIANIFGTLVPPQFTYDEIRSAGNFGLLRAVEKFDPNKGVKFETYAAFKVRGAILDELRAIDPLPRIVRQRLKAIESAFDSLSDTLGRIPTLDEIAGHAKLKLQVVNKTLRYAKTVPLSINHKAFPDLDADDERTLEQFIYDPAPDPYEAAMRKDFLSVVLKSLPPRDSLFIAHYFVEGQSQDAIGAHFNVTDSAICATIRNILCRLRTRHAEAA